MTREELRQALQDGADKLRHSAAWRFLKPREQMLSLCARQFWSEADPTTDAALDALLALVNAYRQICAPGTPCWEVWGFVPPALGDGPDGLLLEHLPDVHEAELARRRYVSEGYTGVEIRAGTWPRD